MTYSALDLNVPSPSRQWISTPRLNDLRQAVAAEARPTTFSLEGSTDSQVFNVTRLKLANTTLYGSHHSSALHVVSDPLDTFEVYIPAAGELTTNRDSTKKSVRRGEAIIYFPGECANNHWSAYSRSLILRVDKSSLEPLIHDSLRLYMQNRKRGAWSISLNHGLGRALLGLLTQICTEYCEQDDDVSTSRLHMENLLHHTLAYIIEELLAENSDRPYTNESEPKYLRQVIDYIFANLEKNIALSTLTEVSGMSTRTLQNAFSKHYGKGPVTFVKHAKLHRVREALQRSTPADTTVTRIATKWGFYHASNFSRNYSDLFGELPIQTLRNRTGH